jgi:hypothetical protein
MAIRKASKVSMPQPAHWESRVPRWEAVLPAIKGKDVHTRSHQKMNKDKNYLTEKEASIKSRKALSTLRNDRLMGRGLPYIKVGRSVRYDLDDIIAYMESHKIVPTGR